MAEDQKIDQTVKWLLGFYSQLSELNVSALNVGLRKGLRLLAAKNMLQYTQDNLGNIYVSRAGRDAELAPIGVCFPLDASISPTAFEGALRTFLSLQNRSLACGITLIGWSSPGGTILGQEAWHSLAYADTVYLRHADLRQFSAMPGADMFSMSALFEIEESQSKPLRVCGSPVLVQKALETAREEVKSNSQTLAPGRSPKVKFEGKGAVSIGAKTLEVYNDYVVALFDNFD